MRKRSMVETVVLSAALILIPLVTRAALEESKIVVGVVKAISDSKITITTPSVDTNQMNELDVQTQADTKFDGLSRAEIKEGDRLKIEYHQDLDKIMADTVTNDKEIIQK